ncbi:Transcription factor tau subunit [Vanrija pseudolonga]|nr:Transcription factor tau subunit [Vanrija pseudolonga]
MIEAIYICRHGYRANWDDPSITTSVTGTYQDPPLAKRGLEQAQHLALHLTSDRRTPDLLFSSPFYRCLQTIEPLAGLTGLPVHVEAGIGEWYTPVREGTGLLPRPGSAHILQQHLPDITLDAKWTSLHFPDRKGETVEELRVRCDGFVETFIPLVEATYPDAKVVLLMCHAATVIGIGRAVSEGSKPDADTQLVGDCARDIRSPTVSLSEYRRRGGKTVRTASWQQSDPYSRSEGPKVGRVIGQWEHVVNADTSFLPNGAEVNWNFGHVLYEADGSLVKQTGDGRTWTEDDIYPVGPTHPTVGTIK